MNGSVSPPLGAHRSPFREGGSDAISQYPNRWGQKEDQLVHSSPVRALDTIVIAAPVSAVWSVLIDVQRYPEWWPRSLGVRVLTAQGDARGSEIEMRPLGGRSFRCRFEEIEPMTSIRIRYFGGFIEGTGEFRLESMGQGTRVSYQLDALAHGRLVALIGRVIDLGRVHSRSMQQVLLDLTRVVLAGSK